MMKRSLAIFLFVTILTTAAFSQSTTTKDGNVVETEKELRAFYDSYAADLINARGENIARRYSSRGYYHVGNGVKELVSFDDARKSYTTSWIGPKAFAWKDLSLEVLSPTSATVVGLFDWESAAGAKSTISYSAVLVKESGEWRIRVEDESVNSRGYSSTITSGDPTKPGPFKYTFTAQAGASISAHKHTADMTITVKSGRKFILMGDLNNAKVQVFEAGAKFVIPANTWHVEWWEQETVEEIEMIAPTTTVRATPSTPRP